MMKKVLQSIVLLLGVLMLPTAAYAQDIYGDVNGDLEVNIADVNAVIDVILDGSAPTAAADVNGDGEINIGDINEVIDIILGGQETQAVVHVYGEDGPTEGGVVNVTDATVTVTCNPGSEPKVGEIIVSGVTGNAPEGFLRRVESVQSSGGQCVMTTTNASIDEVLTDGDFDLPVPLDEQGETVTVNAPGQAPERVRFSTSLEVGVKIRWNNGVPVPKLISDVSSADVDDVLEGKEDKNYPLKIIGSVSPSLDLNFIYSKHNNRLERIGLKGNADVSVEILGKISIGNEEPLHLLGDDGIKLFTIRLKPVTVMAGYVPIVFTPRIDVYAMLDASGEVYLQSKFVAAKAEGDFSYIYTPTPDPITGQNHNFTTSFSCSSLGDGHLSERMKNAFAPTLGINGSLKLSLPPTLNVSLYGANDIFNVGVPITPWVKADGNLALVLKKDIELDYDDQIIISGGVDIGLSAKFKLKKKTYKWQKDINLFETQLFDPIGITPRFENFQISPESPIPADTRQVRFSMDMTKPDYQLLPDEDYGFTYGFPGQDRTDTWTFISEKSSYDADFTPTNRTQYIEAYVDSSWLKKDTTYRVCPYVTVLGTNIYKKGENFRIEEGDWVDLGLPSGTLWATRNVGATAPEEYGDYFAWGETAPKDIYDYSTYRWCNGDYDQLTKYSTDSDYGYNGFVDNKTELDPADDAAYVNWGSSWRMPTTEQQRELIDNCTWMWTVRNGVYGQLGTGPNGNTIFLPAAGYRSRGSRSDAGSVGYYWSRTLDPDVSSRSCYLHFYSGYVYWRSRSRHSGFAVRAVRVSQN